LIGDAGNALVASLGGSANMGSADVAAASQDANGTLAALGAAEDQYNNDLAPLLAAERASQLVNQGNKDTAQTQADQLNLENLQGQGGQAKVASQANIDQENNALAQGRAGMLLNIKDANNQLAQQGFNDSLALAQADRGADGRAPGADGTTESRQERVPERVQWNTPQSHAATGTRNRHVNVDPKTKAAGDVRPVQRPRWSGRTRMSVTVGSDETARRPQAINNVLGAWQTRRAASG
jgi:hypothetical protein